ncbi:PD-(D/E)XK nuclease-like domain-containing protein [Runella sp.]|uniref:PD-(D/E)XK nuclease-like domain-containing protein n=1 Tax=Runella sp. TaxID=1960881 RepID=UPI0026225F87|nr:PD-(D/E)XK nuclease-like domain-containing protein [Runella sp.]
MPIITTNYRQIPAISNSDLTEFKNHLFGRSNFKPQKAFDFGTALHEMILEPKKRTQAPAHVDIDLVQHLSQQVRADKFCQWILQFASKEQVHLFTDSKTELPCKTKLDLNFQNRLIVDLKTTSQTSYERFMKSCLDYDYDRQAAFYLDSVKAKRFIFIGIAKKAPHGLYFFEADHDFIAAGRKKYQALLRKWREYDYVPISWGLPMAA